MANKLKINLKRSNSESLINKSQVLLLESNKELHALLEELNQPIKNEIKMKDEEIIVDFITSKINVESIILTGSRAIGTMSSDSDFDILLVMSSMKTIFNLTKI